MEILHGTPQFLEKLRKRAAKLSSMMTSIDEEPGDLLLARSMVNSNLIRSNSSSGNVSPLSMSGRGLTPSASRMTLNNSANSIYVSKRWLVVDVVVDEGCAFGCGRAADESGPRWGTDLYGKVDEYICEGLYIWYDFQYITNTSIHDRKSSPSRSFETDSL